MDDGDPIICFAAMIFGGMFFFYVGLQKYELKKIIELTPTAKAIAVAPGINEVSGKAKRHNSMVLTSPYRQKECVYYKAVLYKWSGSGKHRNRSVAMTLQSTEPFLVQDDTGWVIVNPSNARADMHTNIQFKTDEKRTLRNAAGFQISIPGLIKPEKPDPSDKIFLETFAPRYLNYPDKLELEETYIEEDDHIFVIGNAELTTFKDGSTGITIKQRNKDDFFCLYDGTEQEALSSVSSTAYMSLIGGPILAFLGYALILARFGINSFTATLLGIIAMLALYSWIAIKVALAFINAQTILRNGVEKALANNLTLLEKRATLIPLLVEVVKGYSKYEKGVQEGIAGLRAMAFGDSEKTMIAITEKYPKLKADQNFLKLQEEITRIESQVAASRRFINDSIGLHNSYIEKFPYNLVAGITGMRRMGYPGIK